MSIKIDMSQLVTAEDKAATAKAALKEAAKARRDLAIYAGVSVDGTPIKTTARAQSNITAAAFTALVDESYVLKLTSDEDEVIALGAKRIITIAQIVRNYVQACFDRHSAIIAAIEAGESYDPETGWPAQSFTTDLTD